MVDFSAISAVANSLRLAGDMTKAIIDLRDAQAIQSKVIELQSIILSAQSNALSAQSDQFSLVDKIRDLEQDVMRLKDWEAQKERYYLKDLGGGKLVYSLKDGVSPSEPTHYICANCYNSGRKSVLQSETWNPGRCSVLVCQSCHSTVYVTGSPSVHHPGYRRGV